MKRFLIILMLTVIITSPVMAGLTARLTDAGGSTNGGPFNVELEKDGNPYMNYVTFCVEDDRYISLGGSNWYTTTIDSMIYYGDSQPNALDVRTQKLYSAYLNGAISDVDKLQKAFWQLEASQNNGIDIDTWITNLDTAVNGCQQVRVLNLWAGDPYVTENDKQSQLIRIPAPGAILLGSIGIGLWSAS